MKHEYGNVCFISRFIFQDIGYVSGPLEAEQDPAFNQSANKSSSFDVARV